MLPRLLFVLAALTASTPALHAQAPAHVHPSPPPEASGARLLPSAPRYPCDPAQNSRTRRCASTATPGNIAPLEAPQFFLLTVDDCIKPETEAHVRRLVDATLRNPDGRPVPITYFLSLEGCPTGGVTDPALVRQRYEAGDEIAVHTRTHTTFDTTRAEVWRAELQAVRDFLRTTVGLTGADVGRGFRAPRIGTNAALYNVLSEQNYLYDASVFETPFFTQVSTGLGGFIWPYTFDVWGPLYEDRAQRCEQFQIYNKCATSPQPGLWEIPLYEYVKNAATPLQSENVGAFDVGNTVYNPGAPELTPVELEALFNEHFNARYNGNRAPMNFFFHPPTLARADLLPVYQSILRAGLSRSDVWAVTMQGLIEWIQDPVPASGMKAWYASYCTRHVCPAPVAAEAASEAAPPSLRLYPNPAAARATAEIAPEVPGAVVAVHDVLGREVTRLTVAAPGLQVVALDLAGAAPGIYVVTVRDGARTHAQPLAVR